MPLFTYKARDTKGNVVEDTIQSANTKGAATSIRALGLEVLTIKSIGGPIKGIFSGGISVSEKAVLTRFLSTMLRSGMSLPDAVEIIRQDTKNKKLQKVLADVSFQTRRGKSLSFVLSQYKGDFDSIFLTMVRVGEESGTLEKSFSYLSEQLASSNELSQKVKGALLYPAVIMLAMVVNGLLMAVFVLPRIAGAFLRLDIPLPSYTRIILTAGEFFGKNVPLVIGATVVGLLAAVGVILLRPTRTLILRVVSRMPVVSKVALHIDVARFSRTLSTLLKSGAPIIDALDVSADSVGRPQFKKAAKLFSKGVAEGESLSSVIVKNRELFPSIMVQTIKSGEQSGSLDQVLSEMADFYEKEIEFSLKRLTSLLEPTLMLAIGVVVGVMVIMMIAPIYSIIGGLQETIK